MADYSSVNGVDDDNITSVNGVAAASIESINGVDSGATPHVPLWTGVGRDARVMYSSDALSWTEYDSPSGALNDYWDISFGKDNSGDPRWIISTNTSSPAELRYSPDPTDSSTWSNIDDLDGDTSRTVEYSATGTWIAGTSEGVVFRSTDGGDSWTEITDVAAGVGTMLCLATDGTGTWLVGGMSKVLKSYDDGLNWYESFAGRVNGIEYNNGVWFMTGHGNDSYRATTIAHSDTTDTWTVVTGISEPMWAICHISGDTWMAGPFNRYPYLSTDNCVSWTQVGVASPGSGQIMALASDGTTVALGNKSNKIYTSTDNGGSWTLRHSSTEEVLVIEYNKVKPF